MYVCIHTYIQHTYTLHTIQHITESACARSCVFLLALSVKVMPAGVTLTRGRAEFNSPELEPNSRR